MQNVIRDEPAALYRCLNVTGSLTLINIDRFTYTKNTEKGAKILEFYNGDKWVPLTKTSKCLAQKPLSAKFDFHCVRIIF